MAAIASTEQLPLDVRLMQGTARGMFVLVGVAMVVLLCNYLLRLPMFAFRVVTVDGDVSRNSVASLRANAMPHVNGNFFTLNMDKGRQAFEAVPWVRHAVVRRVWPNRLHVMLQEHRAVAYWEGKVDGAAADSLAADDDRLVNSYGEVFEANLDDVADEAMPILSGPAGSSAHMLTMLQGLTATLKPLDDPIERLDLSGRGSWRVTLDKGAHIEIGRGSDDEVLRRVAQFVHTITQVTSRNRAALAFADLRHADGYAVRLQGVSVGAGEPPARGYTGGPRGGQVALGSGPASDLKATMRVNIRTMRQYGERI